MPIIISTNPSRNFAIIGEVAVTSPEEITTIIQKSRETQLSWSSLTVSQRIQYLTKSYGLMVARTPELANILCQEMGMPIRQARDEVTYGLIYFKRYLDNAESYLTPQTTKETATELHTVYYEPK